jgi:transketolase C-terminal domain/subunit
MSSSIENIEKVLGAKRFGDRSAQIDWILTDSRSLCFPEETLFFALKTKRNDGHKYLPELYERGVRNFVVGELPADMKSFQDANFLQLANPLKGLQKLAEKHREQFQIPVIGITGSNGKTIVKEWLYQLLSPDRVVTRSPRSYNSQIGVPLSVWLMNERTELAIFEAGISEMGEMEALQTIIKPTVGILTNIGGAHQENFFSLQDKCMEKLTLFKDCDVIIYDGDNELISSCVARVLKEIKDMQGPKLLHIHTTKGKGFGPAEKAATIWHAPGIFDKETGERIVVDTKGMPPLFQDVFGNTLLELAQTNDKIVGVTPAMPSGCSMNILMKTMPERGFDVGIAEGHAVTFSGGMAKDGLLPFCNIYSSFMQRAYDNVIHDIAIQKLNVVLCLDRAGLVGEDGPTHHGAFDLAYMRPIPNLIVASPYNEHELRCLMYTAQLPDKGPFVIRYPRGRGSLVDWKCPMQEIEIGKGRKLKEGKDIAVITLGPIGVQAEKAITHAEQETGKSIAHYDLRFLKPLDESMLHEIGKRFKQVVTVEDGVLKGGMGSAILEFMADNEYNPQIKRIGLPDQFVQHGSVKELYHICGMDEEGIYKVLISF